MMKPKAFIYGERPHRELSIHGIPLWSFNDKDNVHTIENQKQMADEIVATRGSLNNHLIYLQGDYPGIINDASKIEPAAKVSCIKYDEDTKTFIADITSTNQQFIDMIDATEYFPRVHPCYEAETHQVNSYKGGEHNPKWTSSTFKRLLCWLVEPIKNITKISIEYLPEGKSDESENGNNDTVNDSLHVPTADEMPLSKDDVYNIILKNIQPVFNDSFSDDGKRKWFYESCDNSFNWRIHTPKAILQIGASLVFDTENKCWVWEIHTHDRSNVNVKVYADKTVLLYHSNYDDFSIDFMRNIRDDLDKVSKKYNREYRSKSKSDTDNEKADLWEIMRTGINKTLNAYCDTLIFNSIFGGSYERLGSLRRITLGEKTIDVILQFDTDLNKWLIFIGDATKPRILIDTNGDINADISAFIPDPLCFKDIQTLCDMLGICKNNNWQVKEDTREERMKSCEASEKDSAPKAFSQSLIKDGKRPSKINYYLAMAEVASTRGTCLRRRFGSVIVKDDRIVSTGYVGAPSGRQNCCDVGYCFREANNIPAGTMYERCRSSHSEMNAIINASKEEMKDATLYLVGVEPDGKYTKANCCAMCKKVIINSGISKVIARQSADEYIEIDVDDWKKNDDSLNSNHKGY